MKTIINRFMSLFGYVPAPPKPLRVTCTISLAPGIDRASLDAAIAKLRRAVDKAQAKINTVAALQDFGANDLCAESGRDLLLAEVRKHTTLLEVLAKQGEANRRERYEPPFTGGCVGSGGSQVFAPATGSDASGLPG